MITPLLAGLSILTLLWFSWRYAWWRPATSWNRPRVLMYHMVCCHRPGTRFNKLRVPPDEFRKQVSWLRRKEFTFLHASELLATSLPMPAVCLTFDDGYRDNLLEADRILAEYEGKATLYLVTEREGSWSSKKKAHHPDDELASEPKLSDEEVRELLATGRWELGGHTTTHANLSKISTEDARREILAARQDFAERFGVIPPTFAYPFGIYESRHCRMAEEAGYLAAVTVEPGVMGSPPLSPYEIPRVKISGKEGMPGFLLRMRGGKRGLSK
jgi:peptidoglycan/xylan/chitin deacetylase (PgdA/CDA1 family)